MPLRYPGIAGPPGSPHPAWRSAGTLRAASKYSPPLAEMQSAPFGDSRRRRRYMSRCTARRSHCAARRRRDLGRRRAQRPEQRGKRKQLRDAGRLEARRSPVRLSDRIVGRLFDADERVCLPPWCAPPRRYPAAAAATRKARPPESREPAWSALFTGMENSEPACRSASRSRVRTKRGWWQRRFPPPPRSRASPPPAPPPPDCRCRSPPGRASARAPSIGLDGAVVEVLQRILPAQLKIVFRESGLLRQAARFPGPPRSSGPRTAIREPCCGRGPTGPAPRMLRVAARSR